jgi:predicted phage-related endonuclease
MVHAAAAATIQETPEIPPHLTVLPRKDEAAFHATRATGIGGTDVPKILGVSKWGTPFSVYAAKIGLVPPEPAGEQADAGIFLEPWVLSRWVAKTGKALWTPKATFRVVDRPWELMNPDGVTLDGETIVDAKTRSPFDRKKWGEEGSPDTPEDERLQVEWYCAIWGAKKWELPVSFDRQVEVFRGDADRDLGQMVREEVQKFWFDHVVAQIPPTPLTGEAAAEFLRLRFPKNTSTVREAVEYEAALAKKWKTLKDALADAEVQLEAVENEIKLCIGPADGIKGDGWGYTWKKAKDSEHVDAKATLEELMATRADLAELVALLKLKHTETRPGSRRFVPARNFQVE